MVKIALDPAMYHNDLSVADEHCARPPSSRCTSPVPYGLNVCPRFGDLGRRHDWACR